MERLAIVCCIESGLLEAQTVRLAESIRRFAGGLKDTSIIAVRPRRGPSLANSTRLALRRLQVELIEKNTNTEFAWQHYTNKVLALLAAEEAVQAQQYIWLDSDVLVLAEPKAMLLGPEEDFAACAPDKGVVASTGPSDSRDAGWARACEALEIPLDSLPWVTTFCEGARIRFYLNDGIFSYRGGIGFAQNYVEDCFRYLRARQSKSHSEVHFTSQIVIGLTVIRQRLRWRLLPHSCNYGCHSKLLDWVNADEFAKAEIVHYHDMLEPEHWQVFCRLLEQANHPMRDELVGLGQLEDPSGATAKIARESLRIIRGAERRRYYRACGFSR
jgi:hypothetical protein